MSATQRGDLIGRIIGLLVFFVGVGLLLLVFKLAYGLFTASPATALGIKITGDPKHDPGAALIGQAFGHLLIKILLLFMMSVASSFIAQKGINLFFSCAHAGKRDEVKQTNTPTVVEAPTDSPAEASSSAKP